jgi:hypothetical protein
MRQTFAMALIALGVATTRPLPSRAETIVVQAPDSVFTTGRRAWALATTALLTYRNRDRIDTLLPDVRSDSSIVATRRLLHDWWEVDDRADLLRALTWLERGGHRVDFQTLSEKLVAMTDAQFQHALTTEQDHPNRVHIMKLMREYYRKHRENSLIGWDYSRYIMLCRWGYLVGFMSEGEAWRRIMPAARKIQTGFGSWAELGEDYLIGREFCSSQETANTGQLYRDIHRWLVNEPQSPWNRLPWRTELKAEAAAARR